MEWFKLYDEYNDFLTLEDAEDFEEREMIRQKLIEIEMAMYQPNTLEDSWADQR